MANPYTNRQVRRAIEGTPIGGGESDSYTPSVHPADADIAVSTRSELKSALRSSADIIAIEGSIDTGDDLINVRSKTLVGGRGWPNESDSLLHTDTTGYRNVPWTSRFRPHTTLYSSGDPHICGLKIRGGEPSGDFTRWDYDQSLSRGIALRGRGGEVENCEIWGHPWTQIHLRGATATTDAEIHHCDLHHGLQLGYGYAIDTWDGRAYVHNCYMNNTRHSVNLFGYQHTEWTVENCIIGPDTYSHSLDTHALGENGSNRSDDPDDAYWWLRSGRRAVAKNVTFCYDIDARMRNQEALVFRGVPVEHYLIDNCRFVHPTRPPRNSANSSPGNAWRQVNVTSSRASGQVRTDSEGWTINDSGIRHIRTADNQFGYSGHIFGSEHGAQAEPTDLPADPTDRWERERDRRRVLARNLRAFRDTLAALRSG